MAKVQLAKQLEWGTRTVTLFRNCRGPGVRVSPQLRLVSKLYDRSKDRPTGLAGVISFVTTSITAYCVSIYTSMVQPGTYGAQDGATDHHSCRELCVFYSSYPHNSP